ncbi:MAG: GtrA family protein [Gammaproteobacteria bacterium]|jgi:putative flippase GtrA|uniref:GtrA family protein n=1 Tax=Pseudomonas mandelii TaxID=75612 RepID=A0AB36CQH4_9PSED|nr:GtrA family protein [Pseudomonas mandelii]MBU0520897.1 GtrA family protein [Gammaproteobacteria bacterium]MBU0818744.1 GtrA family protein [Gammaproteobacteria bacterium]MBU0841799.1 GtrA family protein [Gammaproteobacteria bacterium]MBU1840313.1 GtrA family protein [Gammaproteobacteria bacterium]MSU96060.1 GtrA family protein [Pseudomonas mandelii]
MKHYFQCFTSLDLLQLVRYYLVGALVNAGGYVAFLVLLHAGMEPKLAASVLYVIGALVSFGLNRKLVFDSAVQIRTSLIRLFIMLLAGYVLNMLMLYVFVDLYTAPAWLIQIISVVLISVLFYLANKFYVHESDNL